MIIYPLTFFWFFRQTRALFFWLYLWQLKEYHLGRFIAHFSTEKGKKLIINPIFFTKIVLFFGLFFYFKISLYLVILVYILETLYLFYHLLRKTLKLPLFTKKVIFLSITGFLVVFLIIIGSWQKSFLNFSLFLLISDILSPAIFSAIVLIFQPVAAVLKMRIINKAKRKREKFPNLTVIGITGSYGKTSTKEFLAAILSEKFNILKTKEHQNSEMGISFCVLNDLKEEHQIFIVEMGAYNRGGIKLLCDITKPKIGILTGINEQHMATFGSQENIIKTKYELIESLPKDGVAFFNAKNKYCIELYQKTNIKKYLYGGEAKVFGEENILGAKAVARELGMTENEIAFGSRKIGNKLPGIEQKKGIKGLIIFEATYSANPDSVIGHLEYLKNLPGKKIIIMPCLIELGSASRDVHKRMGKKIGEVCDLAIVATKERFKEIKEATANSQVGTEVLFIENPKKIVEKIKSFTNPGDVVLLEGRLSKDLINQLIISNEPI